MKLFLFITSVLTISCFSGCSQNKPLGTDIPVGGPCEGCEAIYECPVPFTQLDEVDTLPGFTDAGPRLEISGIIFHPNGKTPAAGIVMYVYHTDQGGIYPKKGNEKGWAKRHGYIRGWIKTNANGEYRFYTLMPASYPNSSNQKHIHPVIKEPGKQEYWIDEFVFADDPLLPEMERNKKNPVGGSGVLTTTMKNGILYAKRNIVIGLNVANYKKTEN